MTLRFSTHWPDKTPTYFPEKIMHPYDPDIRERFPDMIPKIHTFRQGFQNWRPGMDIQMVTGNRSRNRKQFNNVCALSKCVSIQFAEIRLYDDSVSISIDEENGFRELSREQVLLFAANDGFNSVEEMRRWFFRKSFNPKNECWPYGVIIHWTDFRY